MAQTMKNVLTAFVGLALSGALFAAAPTVSTQDFVDKLDSPWDMAFMKDGTMFFTEKCKGVSVRMPSGTVAVPVASKAPMGRAFTHASLT